MKRIVVLDASRSDCPLDVQEEVRELWMDMELCNDYCYYEWDYNEGDNYPAISKYLKSKCITECLIHWWW